jgi:hypothetical protein
MMDGFDGDAAAGFLISSITTSFGFQSCLKLTIGRPGLSLTIVGRGSLGL